MTRENDRPAFLNEPHKNGAEIIAAFRVLPKAEAAFVDEWLLVNDVFGSLTWQESLLLGWINDRDATAEAFGEDTGPGHGDEEDRADEARRWAEWNRKSYPAA